MKFFETALENVYIIDTEVVQDKRGYFTRTFCEREFIKQGLDFRIVQSSISFTRKKGTIRGMHLQRRPRTEDKIVRCQKGKIYDVVIDLRNDSSTFGRWIAQELSAVNRRMLYIPKGCAHGFQTLEDNCEVLYFMSEYYSSDHATGVLWDDEFFHVDWPLEVAAISEKDTHWLPFNEKNFPHW
jgi:dTDP-4-dehydrorhamnose 3,5-epimerase